jgi:hypothetical protein
LSLHAADLWGLLQIEFDDDLIFKRGRMSVKAMMATILQNQMTLRGVHSLTLSAYEEIVERLIEQLRELELSLAVRELPEKHEPEKPSPSE